MINKTKEFIKSVSIFIGFFFVYSLIYTFFYNKLKTLSIYLIQIFDITVLIVLSIILFIIFKKELLEQIKNFKIKHLKKYFIIYTTAYILLIIANYLIYNFANSLATNEAINQSLIKEFPLLSFISMCILAPFYEEILVRLNFQKIFKHKWIFIISTGIFFGSLHLLAAQSANELIYIIPYSILGIALSYIYKDQENIYYSILFHSFNNIIQVILILFGGII